MPLFIYLFFFQLTLADNLQDIHQTPSSRPNTQVAETNQRPVRSYWQPRVWSQGDNQRENSCLKTTIVAPQEISVAAALASVLSALERKEHQMEKMFLLLS